MLLPAMHPECMHGGLTLFLMFLPRYSYVVAGDYSSSDVNSYYQQFYIAGHDSGNVNVYAVPGAVSEWSVTTNPSPSPYFTNVYCNNDAEFVSYYSAANPTIKCYNHAGAIQSVYNATVGYYPIKTCLLGSWLLAEEKCISSPLENLLIYYASSTVAYSQTTIPGPVVALYGQDDNDVYLFGNNTSGGAYIKLYSISNNTFYTPAISLNIYGQLLSAAQVNAGTYLLGFSNGSIYQYTNNPINLTALINGVTASTVRYDSISNQVITASGKIVSEYNYSGLPTLINSVTLSDSVRDLRVLYNK